MLTPVGLELLPKASKLLDELAASLDRIREQASPQNERVAIGCLPSFAAYQLPAVLREFRDVHPNVSVKVHDNSAMEITQLVLSGSAEFGITIVSPNVSDLEVKVLVKEPFVLLCAKGDPLARRRFANWSQLGGTPLIRISPQAANRALVDDALGSRREALNWRYEVQHLQTAVGMVSAGVGLAVVPHIAATSPRMAGLVAVPLRNPSIHRTIGILTRRDRPLSLATEALLRLIRRHFESLRSSGEASH
jgi:DNA-binding transcriptional LysR family regulator